jgi:hypothetical protein
MLKSEFFISENGQLAHEIVTHKQTLSLLFSDFEPSKFRSKNPFWGMLNLCQKIHNKEILVWDNFQGFWFELVLRNEIEYYCDLGRFLFSNRNRFSEMMEMQIECNQKMGIFYKMNCEMKVKIMYCFEVYKFMIFCKSVDCDVNELLKFTRL